MISIHALRVEGDLQCVKPPTICSLYFYPRPPGGGRHEYSPEELEALNISIHALRVEGDQSIRAVEQAHKISIHALRVEGDTKI